MNTSINAAYAVGLVLNNTNSTYAGHLNYTIWNETLGILTFDRSKTNLRVILDAIGPLFNPEVFTYRLLCAYSISGQYGFLPRLLYYVLLGFSFTLRKHEWLSTGALAGAMAYASSACVHSIALLLLYEYNNFNIIDPQDLLRPPAYYGDVDIVAIFPILVSGCVMLLPILNWSDVVRKHEARAVVICWGILMYLTMILTLRTLFRWTTPYIIFTQVSSCIINSTLGCTADDVIVQYSFISSNFYRKCNCSDTCGAVTIPGVPLRKGSSLQAYLIGDTVIEATLSKTLGFVFYMNLGFLILIASQGIVSLFKAQWEQREVRNWIFRYLIGRSHCSNPSDITPKLRFLFAKYGAAVFYLTDIVAAIISPFIFISSVFTNEIRAWGYPVSESSGAVGQWSSWATVGFVILAALIQRYNSAWMRSMKLGYSTSKRLVMWIFGRAEIQVQSEPVDRNKDNGFTGHLGRAFRQCEKAFVHASRKIERSWKRVQEEWHDFRDWWRNPISVSNRSILPVIIHAAVIETTVDLHRRASHGEVQQESAKSD